MLALSLSLATLSTGDAEEDEKKVEEEEESASSIGQLSGNASYGDGGSCGSGFQQLSASFLSLWSLALLTEAAVAAVALRGTIFHDGPRRAAEYLLYVKLGETFFMRFFCPRASRSCCR